MALTIALAALLLTTGAFLGARRPVVGLSALFAIVAVTPSLLLQLGLPDVPTGDAYIIGLALGYGVRWLAGSSDEETRALPAVIRQLVIATAAALMIASSIALLRIYGIHGFDLFTAVRNAAGVPYPEGIGRELAATLTPLAGLLIFVITAREASSPTGQRTLTTAFLAGVGIAAAGPAIQWLFLDIGLRPDGGGEATSTGWSGFFRDPHSFAAYLVLALGLCLGAAASSHSRGNKQAAWRLGSLATLVTIILVFTNSRGGILSAAVTLVTFASLVSTNTDTAYVPRWRRAGLALVVVLALAGVTLMVSPAARSITHDLMTSIGLDRLAAPLDPTIDADRSIRHRAQLWNKAAHLIRERPLWGVGPGRFPEAEPTYSSIELNRRIADQNAHNYYLQVAAEFGTPALICLLALLGVTLRYLLKLTPCIPAQDRPYSVGIVAAAVGFMAFCLVSHPLLLIELQATFWGLMAVGLAGGIALPNAGDAAARGR